MTHINQTLMSPRYSNVTTSIRGSIIRYASHNPRFIIFNPTQRTSRVSQDFYRRKEYENAYQPLCIDYPNVTTEIRKLMTKTYIKWINRHSIVTTDIPSRDIHQVLSHPKIQSNISKTQRKRLNSS